MQTFLDSEQLVTQKMLHQHFEDTIEVKQTHERPEENRETDQTRLTPLLSDR